MGSRPTIHFRTADWYKAFLAIFNIFPSHRVIPLSVGALPNIYIKVILEMETELKRRRTGKKYYYKAH